MASSFFRQSPLFGISGLASVTGAFAISETVVAWLRSPSNHSLGIVADAWRQRKQNRIASPSGGIHQLAVGDDCVFWLRHRVGRRQADGSNVVQPPHAVLECWNLEVGELLAERLEQVGQRAVAGGAARRALV